MALAAAASRLSGPVLAFGTGTPLGNLLVAIVALAVVVFVGRFLLSVAWRLLVVAGVVVAALYALSLLG